MTSQPDAENRSTSSRRVSIPEFVWHVVLIWWKLAVPIGLVLGGIAAAVVYLQYEPQYAAKAVILIRDRPRVLAAPDISPRFVQNQIELLRSGPVLDPVVADPEIARIPEIASSSNPVSFIAQRLRIRKVGSSETFTIEFGCGSPTGAAAIVNRIVESYLEVQSIYHGTGAQEIVAYLTREKSARALEIQRLRENVRELCKQITGKDPYSVSPGTDNENGAITPILALQNQLVQLDLSQSVLKQQIVELRSQIEKQAEVIVTDAEIDEGIEQRPEVQLRHANHEDRVRRLKEMEQEYETNAITHRVYQQRHQEELESVKEYTGDTLELEFLRTELSQATRLYDQLTANLVLLQTGKGEPERVSLWEDAKVPTAPIEPFPWKRMAMATTLMFLAPFGSALLWEIRIIPIANREH